MSFFKQLVICLVLVAGAGAGWYVYQNPQITGLARETAEGPGAAGGRGPTVAGGGERGPGAGSRGFGANRIPGLMGGGGAVNVITAPVETDAGGETVVALGTARAARSVTLFPQVTGVVTEILFRPGQAIDEGAALVRLQDDEQQVAVDRARVTLEQTRETLERSQALAKSKTITAVALSDAETAAQLAEIEVRSAEIALDRHTVTAPFSGVIGLTDVAVGDLVTSTTEIATLDDLATLNVRFEVPERWAGRIAPDQPISATPQGMPGSKLSGRVSGIDNRVDETTRTLLLEAELENPGEVLKPGMAVSVSLDFDTDQQLAVPTLAVQWDRRGSFVWRVTEGAAERAGIAIIRRQSGIVIVQGDIAAGDRIVVEGIQRLRPGAKVAEVGEAPDAPGGDLGGVGPAGEPNPALSGGTGELRPARS
ncbi:MAG: efflux RND transporter periplasmic adaptor subunit [Rhizobiales bacterium]|nr:efflux RND transporter periplasmic adaptor subunit [Hyphomicrobiales bacterium]